MLSLVSAIPQICISPAPHEDPPPEPYSPFTPASFATSTSDADFRSQHLTPPPTLSSPGRSLSPRRSTRPEHGLERARFEALLQASRERNGGLVSKREQDLRREIALKTHKTKQLERRALFLSKIMAPPSPTAVDIPKTPPESPAIFHFTFPSPGMESPLSLFEALGSSDSNVDAFSLACEPWVEQVDFRLPEDQWIAKKKTLPKPAKVLPSLADISARLNLSRPSSKSAQMPLSAEQVHQSSTRLPAFLRNAQKPPAEPAPVDKPRPNLTIAVDESQSAPITHDKTSTSGLLTSSPSPYPTPTSPHSPKLPKLQVKTLVVPRSSTMSPSSLSKVNLLALSATRAQMSRDMVSALRRRTLASDRTGSLTDESMDDRKSRRKSSPAELPSLERAGFEHPVLALPGGF